MFFHQVIVKCWIEDPDERPPFSVLKNDLQNIIKKIKKRELYPELNKFEIQSEETDELDKSPYYQNVRNTEKDQGKKDEKKTIKLIGKDRNNIIAMRKKRNNR